MLLLLLYLDFWISLACLLLLPFFSLTIVIAYLLFLPLFFGFRNSYIQSCAVFDDSIRCYTYSWLQVSGYPHPKWLQLSSGFHGEASHTFFLAFLLPYTRAVDY